MNNLNKKIYGKVSKKQKYVLRLMLCIPLAVVLVIIVYVCISRNEYEEILKTEFAGRLINIPEYITRKGILLEFKGVSSKDTIKVYLDLFYFNRNIINYANIGDSVEARKGDTIFTIIKSDTILKFNKFVDYVTINNN